ACSQALADCQVKLLNEADGHCTVEVTCANCGVSFVAVLLLKKAKHPDGLPKAASQGPITSDEMLDVHEFMKAFNGPIKELVRWRASRQQSPSSGASKIGADGLSRPLGHDAPRPRGAAGDDPLPDRGVRQCLQRVWPGTARPPGDRSGAG